MGTNFCLNFFSCWCDECSLTKQLREELVYSISRLQCINGEELTEKELERAVHSVSTTSKQKRMISGLGFHASIFPFKKSRVQSMMGGSSHLIKLIKLTPKRHAQKAHFLEILELIKITIANNTIIVFNCSIPPLAFLLGKKTDLNVKLLKLICLRGVSYYTKIKEERMKTTKS